jgi:tetratricopeptide (TPR) repeat protein
MRINMSELSLSTDKIKKLIFEINLPNTISIDIKFKIEKSVKEKLFDLINKRIQIISKLPERSEIKLELDFEISLIKILFYLKKFEECIEYLTRINTIFPDNEEVLYDLGYIHSIEGQLKEAMEYYNKVLQINPDNPQIYNETALLARRMDNLELALNLLKTGLSKDNKHAESWRNLGIIYMELKDFDNAIKSLEKALEINPKYIKALNFLGLAHHFIGNHDIAVDKLNKALDINPKFVMGWKNLGAIYYNLEEYQKSIECYEKIIKIDEKNIEARISIASIYLNKLDDAKKALDILMEAKEINENIGEVYYQIGLVNKKMGNRLEAEKNFNKAIEINPDIMMKLPDLI